MKAVFNLHTIYGDRLSCRSSMKLIRTAITSTTHHDTIWFGTQSEPKESRLWHQFLLFANFVMCTECSAQRFW